MFPYIIMIWNVDNVPDCDAVSSIRRRIQQSAVDWRPVMDRPGMYVACVEGQPYSGAAILVDDWRGVILGTLFRPPGTSCSSRPTSIRHLSEGDSAEILRSSGRSLISNFWGYYVAALHYPEYASAVVLRGPVSPLACLRVERGTVNVFFSRLDDCIDLKLTPLSINWDSITAQVVGGDYLTNETAIEQIENIECGESIQCNPRGSSRHVYWDPRLFLEERTSASFDKAARDVRCTTEYSVSALSSAHESILVKLSGGLDSSIVLSSLSRTHHKPSITAVNYYSSGSGDERRFARLMAGTVHCQLIERARNQQLDCRRFLDCNRTVRPVLNFSAPDVEARNISLALDLNATAIFDGELGDNVYGSHPGPGTLVECFRQSRLGRGFLNAAMDYAVLTRQSLWQTLVLARREALSVSADPNFSVSREMRREFGTEGTRPAMLASSEAEERCNAMGDRFVHPWLKQSRRIAPSSLALLFGLITVTSATYHSPFSGPSDPLRVSPLINQPLLEIALRTPAYLHYKSAQDRAVARAAFGDVLPPGVLQRGLGKGGPDLWAKNVVENNSAFLREFLLEGILVRRRLVDRTKLETALSPRIVKSTVIVGDILAKLYIEAWLRALQPLESPPGSATAQPDRPRYSIDRSTGKPDPKAADINVAPVNRGLMRAVDSIDRIGRAWTAPYPPDAVTKT